jgi:hypothetical protein
MTDGGREVCRGSQTGVVGNRLEKMRSMLRVSPDYDPKNESGIAARAPVMSSEESILEWSIPDLLYLESGQN